MSHARTLSQPSAIRPVVIEARRHRLPRGQLQSRACASAAANLICVRSAASGERRERRAASCIVCCSSTRNTLRRPAPLANATLASGRRVQRVNLLDAATLLKQMAAALAAAQRAAARLLANESERFPMWPQVAAFEGAIVGRNVLVFAPSAICAPKRRIIVNFTNENRQYFRFDGGQVARVNAKRALVCRIDSLGVV